MMEDTGGSCSSTSNLNSAGVKPVVVRVKRKASQSPVEAFWLEINERPQKRAMLDFEKLSISDSHQKVSEVVQNKKVFVQHVETVTNSDSAIDILQSFVSNSTESSGFRNKSEERKRSVKDVNKHNQLLSRSKQSHEFLAKNARFEQIWRSRKGKKESKDGDLHQVCNLYDVVRVDNEEKSSKKKENPRDTATEDDSILRDYLPLLRECLPSAAEEIESDMLSYFSNQVCADDYVYDLYTVQGEPEAVFEESVDAYYPLVQVEEEDDFYDGPEKSEFESDDSNAEDNPANEYPDEEETSEEEDTSDEDEDEDDDEDEDEDDDEDESGSSDKESVTVEDYNHYDAEDDDFFYEEEDSSEDEDSSDDEEYEWTQNAQSKNA